MIAHKIVHSSAIVLLTYVLIIIHESSKKLLFRWKIAKVYLPVNYGHVHV